MYVSVCLSVIASHAGLLVCFCRYASVRAVCDGRAMRVGTLDSSESVLFSEVSGSDQFKLCAIVYRGFSKRRKSSPHSHLLPKFCHGGECGVV